MTDTGTIEKPREWQEHDLVYVDLRRPCSNCGREDATALGVVADLGIYDSYVVTLVDDDRRPEGSRRLACSAEELTEVGSGYDGIIHASPENVAAAVTAGWLEPGSEFYSCSFRGTKSS